MPKYRWATAYEWLKWKFDRGEVSATELFELIKEVDPDTIQFQFQSSMVEDGYFEEEVEETFEEEEEEEE